MRCVAWASGVPALCVSMAMVVGCGETLDEAACPPEGTSLTYENFGAEFLRNHCQGCHASGVKDRRGAPREYAFDTRDDAEAWADRIYVRSAGDNTSMPPGPDDPSEEERDDLAEWLACGAP
jgi:uncharacterized membrane protein